MHPESISPTAHYTGYVWFAHGHSHAAFATRRGRVMYRVLRGPNAAAQAVGLPTLEGMLLARHRLIDLRLAHAIETGQISQIVEIAAGLSARGWRFRTRYGNRIRYVEADLAAMTHHKRLALAELGGETADHHTAVIDALRDDGPSSLDAICARLDPTRGTAIITEGLLNYYDREHVVAMWQRFARALARFPRSVYLSDIVTSGRQRGALVTTFRLLLGAFVKGRVHTPFVNRRDVTAALGGAGLQGSVLDPRDFGTELPNLELAGAGRVRVIEATAA